MQDRITVEAKRDSKPSVEGKTGDGGFVKVQSFIRRPQRVLTAVANRQLKERRVGAAGMVSGGPAGIFMKRSLSVGKFLNNLNSKSNLRSGANSARSRPTSGGQTKPT